VKGLYRLLCFASTFILFADTKFRIGHKPVNGEKLENKAVFGAFLPILHNSGFLCLVKPLKTGK
jgi:hypothetical protein